MNELVTQRQERNDESILVASDEGEVLDDERPDDCNCGEWNDEEGDLPCWPCYRAGFETSSTVEETYV